MSSTMWDGLGNVATVAQLTGIDAAGLIAQIRQVALTVHQNKKECEFLALRVGLLADVLPRLQEQEEHNPSATQSLPGLAATLREAHHLVTFCQGKGRTYRFFNGSRLAERFRDVERKIGIYLSSFPLISHTSSAVASRRRLDGDDSDSASRSSSSSRRSRDDECCGEEFTLAEVVAATNGFAVVLSASDSATVYRGTLRDGREVAVKRLLINTAAGRAAAEDAFFTEVAILSPIRHRVRLVGSCADDGERVVVTHPYTGNGSLYDHLHGHRCTSSASPVTASWEARVQVLLGVARAVEHLHCHAVPLVVHANVTSSAVLLEDTTWAPRLSDFGGAVWRVAGVESQAVDLVAAAHGYADPEHRSTGRLRPASDVYSLGVVMLEVLTGKPPVVRVWDEGSYAMVAMDLVSFALPSILQQAGGRLLDVLDRRPASDPTAWQLQPLQMLANTAARCLRLHGDNRPPIPDVVADLEQALHLICTRGHLS